MRRVTKQALHRIKTACSIEEIEHVVKNYDIYLHRNHSNRNITTPHIKVKSAVVNGLSEFTLYIYIEYEVEKTETDHTRMDYLFEKLGKLGWETSYPRCMCDNVWTTSFYIPMIHYPEIVSMYTLLGDDA